MCFRFRVASFQAISCLGLRVHELWSKLLKRGYMGDYIKEFYNKGYEEDTRSLVLAKTLGVYLVGDKCINATRSSRASYSSSNCLRERYSASRTSGLILPPKQIEWGLIITYPKPCSIYLRGAMSFRDWSSGLADLTCNNP